MTISQEIDFIPPDFFWEVPIGLISWVIFRISRSIVSFLYKRHISQDQQRGSSWQLLSRQTFERPMSLLVLMTRGPRWNTHATIGTLGPITIRKKLSIDTAEARKSAASWTVAVYCFPSFKTISYIESLDPDSGEQWTTIDLPPGDYILGIRYYGLSQSARMPSVRADNALFAIPLAVKNDTNDVYKNLAQQTTLFYRLIHYYIHPMLRLRNILPQSFVEGEYLPVGDPCTLFWYDWFPRGCCLKVEAPYTLVDKFDIYLTTYNRASLPIHSCKISGDHKSTTLNGQTDINGHQSSLAQYTTPMSSCPGFYLIRLRPRTQPARASSADGLVVKRLSSKSG